jgi:hypothetical protein
MRILKLMIIVLTAAVLALAAAIPAAGTVRLDEKLLEGLTYRNLGPFRAGSWITDFAAPEFPERARLYTFYVGTRNGGVWKTVNNGTTFEPIFDGQRFLSIGALGLAPSAPEILYVGTGEAFCARSSNRGDGVHKTTDGGKTWTHLGLEETHHIARMAVHPKNPDIVYVAAMGYLFSENEERGVFKTVDGGATWKKVLYINSRVGVIDLAMNPADPDVLYAAPTTRSAIHGIMKTAGRKARSTRRRTAGRHGGGWTRGCLRAASAGSGWISTEQIRISSMPSLKTPTGVPPRRTRPPWTAVSGWNPGSARSAAKSIARTMPGKPGVW